MSIKKHFVVLFAALSIGRAAFCQSPEPRIINVDAAQVKGTFNRSYNFCIGAGRANEGLRADWQRQLRMAKADCGFRYIRFHGLLSDDMGVYTEDKQGNPSYNFQYTDELFDFLQSIKMKPFVELGFMPNAMASGTNTVFWWKGNITPPKDYQKWDALITHLVQHFTERYGAAEVKTWFFEVWNEPNLKNLFFTGDQADYFKLYQQTANTIKAVDKDYKVGGPATAGNGWITDMISFCASNKVPIDFISTHTYGVKRGFLDQTGEEGVIVSQNKDAVSGDMLRTREQIKASALPNLQLHYTEWSASYTPTDPIHDTYFEAPYILDKIKKASGAVNSMSYWTFTDIFEELGPRMTPFHGGFGLLNYQDIKKPAYFAYQFLNRMGDTELQDGDASSIACRDTHGNVQVLLWDFTITHPGDTVNDQAYYKRDLPAKAIAPAKITLSHMVPGRYSLTIYKIGYGVNDPYTTYFNMDSPAQLTRAQVSKINDKNNGTQFLRTSVTIPDSGVFEKELPMNENDVYWVYLQPFVQ